MKKIIMPLFVAMLGLAIAGAVAAALPVEKAKTFTVYHYTSNSAELDDMQNIANWQGTEESPSCGSVGSIPCSFTYSGDFQELLDSFDDPVDLKNAADSRRTP